MRRLLLPSRRALCPPDGRALPDLPAPQPGITGPTTPATPRPEAARRLVSIAGSGGGSSSHEEGVVVSLGGTVSATSSGAVSLTGTGSSSGTYDNYGVLLSDSGTTVSTASGQATVGAPAAVAFTVNPVGLPPATSAASVVMLP